MRLILLSYTLYLPMCHSLKEKRKIIRSLKDSLRANFNLSVAEVAHQDKHQSAEIGIACLFSDSTGIDSHLAKIDSHILRKLPTEVTRVERIDY
ncbi:DUF503 domain-containing protein [Calditrichota bacterium]